VPEPIAASSTPDVAGRLRAPTATMHRTSSSESAGETVPFDPSIATAANPEALPRLVERPNWVEGRQPSNLLHRAVRTIARPAVFVLEPTSIKRAIGQRCPHHGRHCSGTPWANGRSLRARLPQVSWRRLRQQVGRRQRCRVLEGRPDAPSPCSRAFVDRTWPSPCPVTRSVPSTARCSLRARGCRRRGSARQDAPAIDQRTIELPPSAVRLRSRAILVPFRRCPCPIPDE